MKDFLLNILTIAICLHGIAWHSTERQGPVLRHLLAVYSSQHAGALPQKYKEALIEDIVVTSKVMQFRMGQMIYRVRWIGEESRMLMFNGVIFSKNELSTYRNFSKAFYAKFGVREKVVQSPLESLFFSKAYARTDATMSFDDYKKALDHEYERIQSEESERDQVKVEGDSGFLTFPLGAAKGLYSKEASVTDSEIKRQTREMFQVMTREDQMEMFNLAFMFNGGLAYAMDPSKDFKPGLEFINDLGPTPSSVPFPFS